MKSPFPGMDPYIETSGLWEDFHHDLIAEIKIMLARTVPDHYLVRTGERGYIVLAESEGKEEHVFQTDVGVATRRPPASASSSEGKVAVEEPTADGEPVTLLAQIATEYRESFIAIYELHPDRRLITCLEVLSPSNKRRGTPGWEQYLRKRQGLMLGEASLVEIDLLRGGQRMPMVDPWPNSPYTLLVCRRERAPYCRVWPAYFQRPLPTIPVPLSKPDPDVMLNLQSLVEAIYERSRYDRDIDYTKPLQPALKPEEAAWLEQQLRAAGKPRRPKDEDATAARSRSMQYYDHALMGATLALATGTYRRQGWAIVAMAAAAGSLPDWDAVPYPAGTPYYSSVHRVWGHNLLVAPLLSAAVGAMGYLCWLSARRIRNGPRPEFSAAALAVWVVVGMLASLSHLLADVFYCGIEKSPDWPVRLFWPFSWHGLAVPTVRWADRFVTWLLASTLIAACLRPAVAQVLAVGALLTVAGYVTLHGLLVLN